MNTSTHQAPGHWHDRAGRRGPVRRVALLSAAALLWAPLWALAGCSQDEAQRAVDDAKGRASQALERLDLPDVDWSEYSAKVRTEVEGLVEGADCPGIKRELEQLDPGDEQLRSYLQKALNELDC